MRDNDATGAVAELAASQHGVFSRSQAAQLGFSSRMILTRVARGQWEEPWPRVLRVAGAAESWAQRLIVPTLKSGVVAIASSRGRVAARGRVSEDADRGLSCAGNPALRH